MVTDERSFIGFVFGVERLIQLALSCIYLFVVAYVDFDGSIAIYPLHSFILNVISYWVNLDSITFCIRVTYNGIFQHALFYYLFFQNLKTRDEYLYAILYFHCTQCVFILFGNRLVVTPFEYFWAYIFAFCDILIGNVENRIEYTLISMDETKFSIACAEYSISCHWQIVIALIKFGAVNHEIYKNVLKKMFFVNMLNSFHDEIYEAKKMQFIQFLIYGIQFYETQTILSNAPKFWASFILELETNDVCLCSQVGMYYLKHQIRCIELLHEILLFWSKKRISRIPNLSQLSIQIVNMVDDYSKRVILVGFLYDEMKKKSIQFWAGLIAIFGNDLKKKVTKKYPLVKIFLKTHKFEIEKHIEFVTEQRKIRKNIIPDRKCFYCNKKEDRAVKKLSSCAKCGSVFYCSKNCQNKDWKYHSKSCTKLEE